MSCRPSRAATPPPSSWPSTSSAASATPSRPAASVRAARTSSASRSRSARATSPGPRSRTRSEVRSVALAYPGDLATRTGGYAYDRQAFAALAERGRRVRYVALPDRFPLPDVEALATADVALAGLPDRTVTVVDGLALGAMPAVARRHQRRLALVALVHHPLCLETGLDPVTAARLRASERQALAACRRVIATSPSTAATLAAAFAVPVERLPVAIPGTDPAPVAAGTGAPPQLLCVGTLTPRKGQRLLLGALAPLLDLRWRLLLAGSAGRALPPR